MFTNRIRPLFFAVSICANSLLSACLKDLATDKSLEALLSQTPQQQAATLNNLPIGMSDILKTSLIAKNKELFIQMLTLTPKKLIGHTEGVTSVAFSPDGKYALTGSADNTARLWNVNTLKPQELRGHTGWVTSVAFSPDGKHALTGSFDHTVRLWNVNTLHYQELKGHTGKVTSVAFSPDGKYALTGAHDTTARLWNVNTLEPQQLRGPIRPVTSVAFSPDGKYALTGAEDFTARLWNVNSLESQQLRGHTRSVNSVAFSPDGKYALTGSDDTTARLWHIHCLEKLTLEQLFFMMQLSKSAVNLDGPNEQRVLESFESTIGLLPQISHEDYKNNILVKAYIDMRRRQLLQAAAHDDVAVVTQLLKRGFTLNTCDKARNNLWHYAFKGHAGKASQQVLKLLLSLEGSSKGLKKLNKFGIPAFAEGIIHNFKFTKDFINKYYKIDKSSCSIE
ncbi:WD40 repeat domain-containing protein [Candidatus Dependentiae bacterium]|nr:WD40 repeat domain-containing protein [Candidatus Dependentiae bacterium]